MGRRNGQPQQVVAPLRTTVLHQFGSEVQQLEDGGRVLKLITPQGEEIVLPFGPDSAKKLGAALTAPSLEIARTPPPSGTPLL